MADGNRVKKAIKGSKGGSSSSRTPVEAPDSLNSTARANILDLLGEGEMAGWYSDNPLKDVFLDETPIMNEDGTYNFTDVFLDWREGTQDQPYMTGFPAVENEIAVGVELTAATPWVHAVSNTNLSAINVRLSVLALSKTDQASGDTSGYSVAYAIDLATDGGAYVTVLNNAFTGKCSDKYERGHRIDLPPATTGWQVRVRRLTADNSTVYINDTTFVESFTEILDLKMKYPNSAYVGIKIDAGQFRAIPTRAYRRLGRIMRIPSNYNPVTKTYTGMWDGTFQLGWTNNPAWIFYDLIQNARFGLGEYVDETQIDKWSLYNIAQYCDEMVPDGKGGTEPRFTCTIYLQRQEDAFKVLQDLASVFRGISYWGGGAIIPVCDMPRDPVYTYTNANVKDGKFSYQGSSRRARHTVALVSWSDPADFNRQKVEYVEDEDGIARYGYQPTQITAVGCTSQGQAQRVGRWILLTERYETDTVTFAVGLDGTLAMPGQVIRIADAKRAGRRMGGRIASATATTAVLDAFPNVPPAVGDDLICIGQNGIAMKRTVSGVDIGTKTVTVSAPWDTIPVPHSVWALETAALKTQLASVLAVSEGTGLTAIITALQHEPGKFDAVDNSTSIEERPIIDVIDPAQRPPANVVITVNERSTDGIALLTVSAKWDKADGAQSYDVSWRRENGEWSSPQRVLGTTTELFNAFPGDYVCKVTARNALNIVSIPTVSETFTVPDLTLRPGYISEMNLQIADALDTAQNAQATIDGMIVTFWQDNPPTIGSGTGQAKEGDIWYDTNDGNHAWRVVGGVFIDAQDDEIAQALAAASNAQATADGKVTMFVGPTAPTTGMQLNDLWFNNTAGVKKLFRYNGTDWTENVGDVTLDQLGGTGINILWDEYAHFTEAQTLSTTTIPAVFKSGTIAAPQTVADANAVTGFSLQTVTASADTSSDWFYLSSFNTTNNIQLQGGRKYIFQFKGRASVAGHQVSFRMRLSDGTVIAPAAQTLGTAYSKQTVIFDLTPYPAAVAANLHVLTNISAVAGRTVNFDSLMLEEMLGRLEVASTWKWGTSYNMVMKATSDAANAQGAADAAALDAQASLDQLDAIANDNVLTPNEKKIAKQNWDEVKAEQSGIDAEADRVAVSRTTYDAAMTALRTYLQTTLALIDGSGNWITTAGNTTIVSATWDQKWQDVYVNRQTLLNSIAAKVNNQLQNGVLVPPSFGDELAPNGNFESIAAGGGALSNVLGAIMADGWEVAGTAGGSFHALVSPTANQGSRSLCIRCDTTTSVPGGGSTYVSVSTRADQAFPVVPNENFFVTCSVREDYSTAIPAGITTIIGCSLVFYDGAGAFLGRSGNLWGTAYGNARIPNAGSVFKPFQAVSVAPANAVKARIELIYYAQNDTGAAINLPAGMSYVFFDSVSVKRVVNVGTSPNMLSNSEFTLGNGSWGNVLTTNVTKVADSYRYQNTNADNAMAFPYQDVNFSMIAGNYISVSVEVGWGGTVTANAYAQLSVEFYNASNTYLGGLSSAQYVPGAGAAGGTKQISVNGALIPTGTSYARFVLGLRGGAVWFFRKPKLERSILSTPYTPGADAGYGTELTYAGSLKQIGDLRNVNPTGFGSVGSAWIGGTLTYSAAAGTPATATISFSAATLRISGVDVAYNAATVGVTGTGGSAVTYLLYFDDEFFAGGTRTLGATTTMDTIVNSKNRVYVGKITVTYPTSGTGGGTGEKPCVCSWAYVPEGRGYRHMGTVRAGEVVQAVNPLNGYEYAAPVFSSQEKMAPCLEIVCENGVIMPCSVYAEIPTDRGLRLAPTLLGRKMLTRVHGRQEWSLIVDIVNIGLQPVNHVVVEELGKHDETGSFWAGKDPDMYGCHHNIKYTP